VKKAVKQETKAEPRSSAPSTPLLLPKRPRVISAETPVRTWGRHMRPKGPQGHCGGGRRWRAVGTLEKLLGGSTSTREIGNGEV
jgi:hypothetical protein